VSAAIYRLTDVEFGKGTRATGTVLVALVRLAGFAL
jgi:hypothetical protein